MRSIIQSMLLSFCMLAAVPMVASAHSFKSGLGAHGSYHGKSHFAGFWGHKADTSASTGGASSVPELDPSAASAAFALLLGGTAVLAGRRRKRSV